MRARQSAVVAIAVLAALGVSGGGEIGRAAPPQPILCKLPANSDKLPASARRGLIQHLQLYPDVSLATPKQRAAAKRILAELVATAKTENWSNIAAVERAGYDTRPAPRRPGDRSYHYRHAEYTKQRSGRFAFDPSRPKAIIFANGPDRPFVVAGAMWSMRRGEHGPTPGGPITRWHSHVVCTAGDQRGRKPLPDGTCARGARLTQGSEMLHVWFTGDLRSAFATEAPEPELCRAGILDRGYCRTLTT